MFWNVLEDVLEKQGVLSKVFSEIQVNDEEIQRTEEKQKSESIKRRWKRENSKVPKRMLCHYLREIENTGGEVWERTDGLGGRVGLVG